MLTFEGGKTMNFHSMSSIPGDKSLGFYYFSATILARLAMSWCLLDLEIWVTLLVQNDTWTMKYGIQLRDQQQQQQQQRKTALPESPLDKSIDRERERDLLVLLSNLECRSEEGAVEVRQLDWKGNKKNKKRRKIKERDTNVHNCESKSKICMCLSVFLFICARVFFMSAACVRVCDICVHVCVQVLRLCGLCGRRLVRHAPRSTRERSAAGRTDHLLFYLFAWTTVRLRVCVNHKVNTEGSA